MLSFLWFLIFGKERAISSKKVTKAPKDCIQAEEERMLPKMKATCHTYACKLVFTNTRPQVNNERQQEREESGQNYRWRLFQDRWMEIVTMQRRALEEANQDKTDGKTSPSVNAASKPMKADIIQCAD